MMSDQTISEALEERTAECSGLRGKLSDANDKKNYWETSYYWSKEDVERLQTRVGELEKTYPWNSDPSTASRPEVYISKGHYITDEQIDAAVDLIAIYKDHGPIEIASAMWKTLNKLNIFRCEVCKRSPGKQYEWGKDEMQPCANCKGKTYTVGVRDE